MKDTWEDKEITPATIKMFVLTHGNHARKILSLLGRNEETYRFAASDVGKSLLKDTILQMESLLDKIIKGTAKEKEVIEYRVLLDFFIRLSRKIFYYLELREKVKGNYVKAEKKTRTR